jgi:hypothetical protein
LSKADEVTRSISSPCLKRQQSLPQQPTYIASANPRTCSPGAEEIAAILNRVGSPLIPEQQDLMAEMKAKGGKRSLAPTPTIPEDAQNAISVVASNPTVVATSAPSSTLINNVSLRMRASAFGDVLKSPSKSSLTSDDISLQETASSKTSKTIGSKQRPKSVVGMIGAKFEAGVEISLDDCSDISQSDSGATTKIEEVSKEPKGMVRKTLAVFRKHGGGGSVDSASSSASESKKITRSKFYTSSSLSSAAKDSSKK